jgi:hypothetical protein
MGATLVQVMAGLGYSEKSATVLFPLVTVLGGGLPGRPGLKEFRALVICDNILFEVTSASGESPQATLTVADSVRRNSEVNSDLGLCLHWLRADVVRLEMPLSYSLLCGSGQNRRAAYQSQFLDQPVATDHRQHDD